MRDLKLRETADGRYDLDLEARDLGTLTGPDLLAQALRLRLECVRGALTRLGHPRYGSKIHDLIGQPRDRENLGLLRRYVRKALLADPRVREVLRLEILLPGLDPARDDRGRGGNQDPNSVRIFATVVSRLGDEVALEVRAHV